MAEVGCGGSPWAMAPSVPSLRQYLDRWLRETVRPNLAPSSVANYEFFSNAYINPSLGSKRLDRLTLPSALDERSTGTVSVLRAKQRCGQAPTEVLRRWKVLSTNCL
jgi:hypothetical protein